MPRRSRRQRPAWNKNWQQWPIVSKVDRAAPLLDVDADALAAEVERAGLEPWGRHSDGSDVFRWAELCEAADEVSRREHQQPARSGARAGAPDEESDQASAAQAATRKR